MSLTSVEITGGIATVTMFNPPRGYMNTAMVIELDRILDDLIMDEAVRVVIYTGGVPGVFIRHYDVAEILTTLEKLRSRNMDKAVLIEKSSRPTGISRLFDKLDHMKKPSIAAINGFCQGGGFEFALCCDFRIAEEGDYQIGLPEVNLGIFPGAGGTERLPRLIGESKALDFILRGRSVPPSDARALGLVSELTTTGGALVRAKELARELVAKSARCLADVKTLVKGTTELPLEEACARARAVFNLLIAEDIQTDELMRRFLANGEDINRV